MLPQHVNIILLSATVPNTQEFAEWVGYAPGVFLCLHLFHLHLSIDEQRNGKSSLCTLLSGQCLWNTFSTQATAPRRVMSSSYLWMQRKIFSLPGKTCTFKSNLLIEIFFLLDTTKLLMQRKREQQRFPKILVQKELGRELMLLWIKTSGSQ
jgi:hypothetical protein